MVRDCPFSDCQPGWRSRPCPHWRSRHFPSSCKVVSSDGTSSTCVANHAIIPRRRVIQVLLKCDKASSESRRPRSTDLLTATLHVSIAELVWVKRPSKTVLFCVQIRDCNAKVNPTCFGNLLCYFLCQNFRIFIQKRIINIFLGTAFPQLQE